MEKYLDKFVDWLQKNKIIKSLRFQIIFLSIIGWGIALSVDRTLVDDYRVQADGYYSHMPQYSKLVRSKSDKVALLILALFETGLFGLGIGFFLAVGAKVFRIKNSNLRRRMVNYWLCISFFLISWYPHTSTHSLAIVSESDPIDNYIIIEVTFHWSMMVCSLTLSYFQYDLIMLMFDAAMTKKKMLEEHSVTPDIVAPKKWCLNFKIHAAIIVFIFFSLGMVFMFYFDPITSDKKLYQNIFLVLFKIVDSILLGYGLAFGYVAIRISIELNNPGLNLIGNFRKVFIISSICIWFLCVIQYFHIISHTHSEVSMKSTISIDYTVHLPIILTTGILAYYQFKLLELATKTISGSHGLSIL